PPVDMLLFAESIVTSPQGESHGASLPHERAFPASMGVARRAFARTGLTLPPQAATESPSVRMFFAALISLSWHTPHSGHIHSRTSSVRLSRTCPQAEQVLLDG